MERFDPENPYIVTASGRLVHLLNPKPEEFTIDDIASALSNLCRYTGHVPKFYSVAEHSCFVSELCDTQELKLWGLLHDAPEAFLGDVSSPLKLLLPNYHKLEERFMYVIAKKYGLLWPMPEIIKKYDLTVFWAETQEFFATADQIDWGAKRPWRNTPISITGLSPTTARGAFLSRFVALV